MKKISVIFCVLGMANASAVFADSVCQRNFGMLNCGPGVVDSISFTGLVDVKGTTITNTFNVLGNVDVQNAQINRMIVKGYSQVGMTSVTGSMDIIGDMHANDLNVSAPMSVIGNFFGMHATIGSTAKIIGKVNCDICSFKVNSEFIGDIKINNSDLRSITLNGKNILFSNTKMDDITVRKPSDCSEQVIQLKDNSVARNINFENLKGVVMLTGNSKILGTVQGGKIITK